MGGLSRDFLALVDLEMLIWHLVFRIEIPEYQVSSRMWASTRTRLGRGYRRFSKNRVRTNPWLEYPDGSKSTKGGKGKLVREG